MIKLFPILLFVSAAFCFLNNRALANDGKFVTTAVASPNPPLAEGHSTSQRTEGTHLVSEGFEAFGISLFSDSSTIYDKFKAICTIERPSKRMLLFNP